jgi:hypothetical protein
MEYCGQEQVLRLAAAFVAKKYLLSVQKSVTITKDGVP